ncbi:MAG: VOC family protein [Bacteroidetes bacterium]|nr:VOC family protein [Bacteroidota bacterium]
MKNQIYTCLWFDGQAKDAGSFYCSVFSNSGIISENPVVVEFELEGERFISINGGPEFSFNPSASLFVTCDTDEEVRYYWDKLSDGGSVLMPLAKYEWSENYGWCTDKFGVNWQIYKGKMSEVNQRIVPLLLFADKQLGNAEKAVRFYTSLFQNSEIQGILHYGKDRPELEGNVMHSQFILNGKVFMAMDADGNHEMNFNEAFSFVVECDSQEEIDFYWNAITNEGEESMCGWCKDKFGVSWQIIPSVLKELMSDPETRKKTTEAFMKMKKFEIEKLLNP